MQFHQKTTHIYFTKRDLMIIVFGLISTLESVRLQKLLWYFSFKQNLKLLFGHEFNNRYLVP